MKILSALILAEFILLFLINSGILSVPVGLVRSVFVLLFLSVGIYIVYTWNDSAAITHAIGMVVGTLVGLVLLLLALQGIHTFYGVVSSGALLIFLFAVMSVHMYINFRH